MKLLFDNEALRLLLNDPRPYNWNDEVVFGWPSLLVCLNLDHVIDKIPSFDETNKLFLFYIETLNSKFNAEVIYSLFDYLFADCLAQIKSLEEINSDYLINRIQAFQASDDNHKVKQAFSHELDRLKELLIYQTASTMHDIVLYLAWSGVCKNLAILFDYQSSEESFQQGIHLLKECLVESFQHITKDGKTLPSFYKLVESLFYYYMREENLEKLSDEEWTTLCQSISHLKSKNGLPDFFYIDAGIVHEHVPEYMPLKVVTTDSPVSVKTRLACANMIMKKLGEQDPNWHFSLASTTIVYWK